MSDNKNLSYATVAVHFLNKESHYIQEESANRKRNSGAFEWVMDSPWSVEKKIQLKFSGCNDIYYNPCSLNHEERSDIKTRFKVVTPENSLWFEELNKPENPQTSQVSIQNDDGLKPSNKKKEIIQEVPTLYRYMERLHWEGSQPSLAFTMSRYLLFRFYLTGKYVNKNAQIALGYYKDYLKDLKSLIDYCKVKVQLMDRETYKFNMSKKIWLSQHLEIAKKLLLLRDTIKLYHKDETQQLLASARFLNASLCRTVLNEINRVRLVLSRGVVAVDWPFLKVMNKPFAAANGIVGMLLYPIRATLNFFVFFNNLRESGDRRSWRTACRHLLAKDRIFQLINDVAIWGWVNILGFIDNFRKFAPKVIPGVNLFGFSADLAAAFTRFFVHLYQDLSKLKSINNLLEKKQRLRASMIEAGRYSDKVLHELDQDIASLEQERDSYLFKNSKSWQRRVFADCVEIVSNAAYLIGSCLMIFCPPLAIAGAIVRFAVAGANYLLFGFNTVKSLINYENPKKTVKKIVASESLGKVGSDALPAKDADLIGHDAYLEEHVSAYNHLFTKCESVLRDAATEANSQTFEMECGM